MSTFPGILVRHIPGLVIICLAVFSFSFAPLTGVVHAASLHADSSARVQQKNVATVPNAYTYHIQSWANGDYASARLNIANAPLYTNVASAQLWEGFQWINNADGTVSFKAANGNFVSARLNVANFPLEAVAPPPTPGPWEKFQVISLSTQAPIYALKAANGNYVSARLNVANFPLEAVTPSNPNRNPDPAIGDWEKFYIL